MRFEKITAFVRYAALTPSDKINPNIGYAFLANI